MIAVIFELDQQRYALDVACVQEVTRAVAITRLPAAPPVIEGVVSLRGELVFVANMRQRFGLPARPLAPDQQLIFARAGDRLVALRVDRVAAVDTLDAAQIEQLAPDDPAARHVAGVAKLADGLLLIHDLATFLTASERAALDALAAAAP